ncbi:MAG: DUF58 domain-containing protein [Candidatus Promineifilaceae bacterium]|nr:DUF58 domain-containing protein [Candidatus Promineifilaceae bacterium]
MLKQRRSGVIILALLSLIGGLATGRDLFFNLTYLLGLLLILSFGWAWSNINWVHISRLTRTRRTQVGRPLEERFTVRNTSVIPKLWLELRDESTLPGHIASNVTNNLGSRAARTWRASTLCRQRGRYRLGPVQLSTSDPFGLFPMSRALPATTNVVVYPLTVDIHRFALPLGVLPGGDALRRRTHYVTTNASGVREYAPGDSISRIHWPSTARRDRLIVKEFELDPLADIWIVADMALTAHVANIPPERRSATSRDGMPHWLWWQNDRYKLPEATEEYTVSIAASLAQHFLRHDRAVGLLAYGQSHEIVQPDRGERQLNRILETLAVLRAQGQVPISDLVTSESSVFPRGTTVIVVTPVTSHDWLGAARQLARQGLRVVNVLIDPQSFGGPESAAPLAELLRASNQMTLLVRCDDDLSGVLSSSQVGPGYFALA